MTIVDPDPGWHDLFHLFSLVNSMWFMNEVKRRWDKLLSIDTLTIPFYIVLLFLCVQVVHCTLASTREYINGVSEVEDETGRIERDENITTFDAFLKRVDDLGGRLIFGYLVARLVGCLTLLGLSTWSLYIQKRASVPFPSSVPQFFEENPEAYMVSTYIYSSILAIITLSIPKWSTLSTRYNIFLLLITLGVYVYRDVWPLATYAERPIDLDVEGKLLWAKVAVLLVTAAIIPFFIPRRYVPVDPKNPMPVTNDEQTCSWFAMLMYTYLDPVIFLGYRVPHLKFDQLPPLADYDRAEYMTGKAFLHLDPFKGARKRHLFFGLMRVFRTDYTILGITLIIQGMLQFLSPVGVNRLLNYLETQGKDAYMKPWFWIMCIFFGPFLRATAFQWYIFIATRTLVRTEGLLTQLVFDHSLRIRLKAETSSEKDKEVGTLSGTTTPDSSSSIAESVGSAGDAESVSTEGASQTVSEHTESELTAVSASSGKKHKKDTSKTTMKEELSEKKDESANLVGKINNLVTTDLNNIVEARDFLVLVLFVPLQISFSIFFLYKLLGWSSFVGLATMIILFPVPGYVSKLIQDVQKARMKRTDARVQDVTEAVNVLRMVKLFGWEQRISRRIEEKRDEELKLVWRLRLLNLANGTANYTIPLIIMMVTYGCYTVIMKEELSASKIFSSISVFNILRLQLNRISYQINNIIQGKVSLDRVDDFLKNTELLDSFKESCSQHLPSSPHPSFTPTTTEPPLSDRDDIGFRNATFAWSQEPEDGTVTPSRRSFKLHVKDELLFKKNCINLVIGPTGSGKTSMLMALLGEMHFIPSTTDSWFNLPREGGVAYAAQESWVQNETIRDNIVFGYPYDEARYREVIKQCALERDLELFEAGDMTEVGEKGLTLSGGQKARITLARAVYSPAKIILLDDVLAALDVHTSTWIVDKCFKGNLVKGRTILLVTHNIALTSPVAHFIVSLGIDGSVRAKENDVYAAIENNAELAKEVQIDEEVIAIGNQEVPALAHQTKADGKLIAKEEIAEGHVTWDSIKLFLRGLGGSRPFLFFSLWIIAILMTDYMSIFQVWLLGYWGAQYEIHDPKEVDPFFYLGAYCAVLTSITIVYAAGFVLYYVGTMRASRAIGTSLVNSVLTATLRWLDETPTGRIIARCTQDLRAVDGPIPTTFADITELTLSMVNKVGVIVIFTPVFLFPSLGVGVLGMYLGNMYLKAQMSVKREMSNARSPLLSHFSAAIAGIVSIRAYGAEEPFKAESLKRIDHYVRIARMSYNLNRWIAMRIDLIGDAYTACLGAYLVYGRSLGAANTGFSLNLAVDFCNIILWVVRIFNEFEVQANSLERIQGFIDIEHEPLPTEDGKPPAAWPTSGDLRVEGLSARYSQTGPRVLHDLSFHINSGERIGIVGRTGSGKSSLTLAVLRCILTEGTVYYDGLPTNKINLDALRSNITIIPQTPELLSGTLRRNLDPFEQHDDATLNDALRAAGLFSLQEELGENRLTLDSSIASGGNNLSVGQKQILALARAMVRGSKLLILDEATSAIDYTTDSVIQATLRHQLPPDVTVITVAHRLQTIMDADKIMVLDSGNIAEFDSPIVLLEKEDGMLRALVDESGDKESLYAMAKEKSRRHA